MIEITLKSDLAEVLTTRCPFAVNEAFKALGGSESGGPTFAESVEAAERAALYGGEGVIGA
jgi:hypothetical protein